MTVEPARYAPDGLIVTTGNPLRTPLAGTGQFVLQDEASQLVALLGAPEPGMRVLDTCASPGGKTTAMAAMAGDRAEIVAADVRSARVQLLRETVSASGAHNIRVRAGRSRGGTAVRERIRCGVRRRALLGARDGAARSRHSMAASRGRSRAARERAIEHDSQRR